MTLNQLHYLLAIHRCGSITKAAHELLVSAPSISIAVKNLEEELNCTLIVRHRNGVSLTEQGEKAIQYINEIERNIQLLRHLEDFEDTILNGEIVFGSVPQINCPYVIPMVKSLNKKYSNIDVSIIDDETIDLIKRVSSNEIHLALILMTNTDQEYFFQEIQYYNLQYNHLVDDEIVFVFRKEHPLLDDKKFPDNHAALKDILQYPYCTSTEVKNAANDKFFRKYNPDPRVIHVSNRNVMCSMLNQLDACTVMPLSNALTFEEKFPEFTYLKVMDFDYRCQIGWIHTTEPLNRIEKVVIAELQNQNFCVKK